MLEMFCTLLLVLQKQAREKFNNDLKDIDLVVGARGSPLQLVLSAVYHIDAPTGNILLSDAEKFIHDPLIEQAIPLAYGDSYKGFRIVGSDPTVPTWATLTAVTPLAGSSFSSRARVRESSSQGLITHWIPVPSSWLKSGTNLIFVVVSGTLLMQTNIFIYSQFKSDIQVS